MIFDPSEREQLARLADVLIPAASGHLSASEAGVANAGLDQVLLARPDLVTGLKTLLASCQGRSPAEYVADLRNNNPAAFGALAEVVTGAYFMNSEVQRAIGYTGQTQHPIDPTPDYLTDGLLDSVIHRGPIYRSTPQ